MNVARPVMLSTYLALAVCALVCAMKPSTGLAADSPTLKEAANQAVFGGDTERAAAIARLRSAGPEGVQALIAAHPGLVEAIRPSIPPATNLGGANGLFVPAQRVLATDAAKDRGAAADARDRFVTAIDQVAQQRGAATSQLYWFTDLEQAKQTARKLNRPILSLRLLGKLTDEFSCANSRFFRTVLYSNQEVSNVLREQFVLYWSSERPVPIVTIDFGDGRVLKRTLTGNSAHYVLDSNGRPVDVLPGLYGPAAFLRVLGDARGIARQVASWTDAEAQAKLREFHRAHFLETVNQWKADLTSVGWSDLYRTNASPMDTLRTATTEEIWAKIAALHAADAKLDQSSVQVMRREQPLAFNAMRLTISKARVEDPLLQLVLGFERSIAQDSVRNEYLLHSRVHQWFANSTNLTAFAPLNQLVYAELFSTPASDPWMGLAPAVYTGLEKSGIALTPPH